tara:strand:- start:185 stop:505 length:321 start_codon:yes stop_codon:yes gene_type:complete
MSKVKLANLEDISIGDMKQISLKNYNYLIANVDGQIFIVDDLCTHEDAELTMGCLKGKTVKCPLHGSYFDLVTGEALNEPADEPIKVHHPIIENGQIYINVKEDVI